MDLETIDLTEWDRFTELWNTDAVRVFEWVEGAETCLQAVREKGLTDQLANDIKLRVCHEISFTTLRV